MIYYFTGTGNSLYVAQRLADLTGTRAVAIAEIMKGNRVPEADEVTGIVYPIYAWLPPQIVLDFVRKYPIKSKYIYSVCTCGEDTGRGMKRLEKAMGRTLVSAFSIAMPNNYITGMDVDPPEVAKRMLADAEMKITAAAETVNAQKRGVYDVHEGSMARVKTGLSGLFAGPFIKSAKQFYAEDSCIGCGRCEAVCPTRNVRVNGKPQWGNDCAGCMACLHHCPVKAIQKGKGTKEKGRYINPNCRVEYDFEIKKI